MSDLLQWPFVRVTYAGIDNPMFVDDIQAANEGILAAAAVLTGMGPTDFAIISGLNYDGSTNYSAGVFYLNGQFYYLSGGCTTGQFLTGGPQPGLSEGFDDGNNRNIYNLYEGQASNAGGAGFSPVFSGNMDIYRAGAKRLMQAVNSLQVVAAALGAAAFLNVGNVAGTVMAGNDPRAPYTAAQLDARYAQIVNVITKGGGVAYTPVAPTDPVNKSYVDSVAITKLASGRTVVGDIPTGGIMVSLSFGKTLPNTNYMLVFTAVSLGTASNDATTHTPAMIDGSKSTTSVSIRIQEGVGVTQNLAYDWFIIPQ